MRFVFFTESLISCWNHGNAHFLRGVIRALLRNGHEVRSYEPEDGWSRQNLVRDHGARALGRFAEDFPELAGVPDLAGDDLDAMLDGANVVIVHEWTDHKLVSAIGRARKQGGRFTLLFHDTHHRMASDPASMAAYDLSGYDGVLAFGESLAVKYRAQGWGDRVFVWHEAADVELFKPPRARARGKARSGSAIGAMTSAATRSALSCSSPLPRRGFPSTFTACATRGRRWTNLRPKASVITAGRRMPTRPKSSPGT